MAAAKPAGIRRAESTVGEELEWLLQKKGRQCFPFLPLGESTARESRHIMNLNTSNRHLQTIFSQQMTNP